MSAESRGSDRKRKTAQVLLSFLLADQLTCYYAVQAMPGTACGAAIVWGLQVFFAISSAQGLDFATWAPQETAILLAAIGSGGCLLTCLAVPRMQRFMKTRGPSTIPLKRMNLLGLVRSCCWGHSIRQGDCECFVVHLWGQVLQPAAGSGHVSVQLLVLDASRVAGELSSRKSVEQFAAMAVPTELPCRPAPASAGTTFTEENCPVCCKGHLPACMQSPCLLLIAVYSHLWTRAGRCGIRTCQTCT